MKNSKNNPVAVITGASSGIGKEAAKALLKEGWKVIGLGRSQERCEKALLELEQLAGGDGSVKMICANIALMSETRIAAKKITELTDRVDVLLNNAGGLTRDLTITSEGNENTFASNHLGHFLLTELLLPLLQKSAGQSPQGITRIVNVSSSAHEGVDGMDWDDLQMVNKFVSTPAYCRAKLANILFTRELAKRMSQYGITVNAMHPGMVDSNFAAHGDDQMQGYFKSKIDSAITPEHAADTLIWLASSPEAGQHTGEYFHNREIIPASDAAMDDEAATKLWQESERFVKESENQQQRA